MNHDQLLICLPSDFPFGDVQEIGDRLTRSGALVPGYNPSGRGLLDIWSIVFDQDFHKTDFYILPDRNLVSRMAHAASACVNSPRDHATQLAIDLMAFAQALNLHIEPSIAYHELALHGEDEALEELQLFRAADTANAMAWINLAQARTNKIGLPAPIQEVRVDGKLSSPLHRWKRNYVCALKLAEIELGGGTPTQKFLDFAAWMYSDFIIAGPAAIYAALYFSPNGQKAGLLKQLHSLNREKALAGIKNAAWDITHMSDFARRVQEAQDSNRRYIFATGDKLLSEISPLLLTGFDSEQPQHNLSARLTPWWGHQSAKNISSRLQQCYAEISVHSAPRRQHLAIDELIRDGENLVRAKIPAR